MRAGAAVWRVREITRETEFFLHLEEIVTHSAEMGVEALVLPEFIDLELLATRPELQGRGQAEWLAGFHGDLKKEVHRLATTHTVTIVAGSGFAFHGLDLVNRSITCSAYGGLSHQDKMVMTQFEIEDWGVAAGDSLHPSPDPRIGVSICYDCEFPSGVKLQAERGVMLLAVPAYTETLHGFHRVRRSCEARAIENQIFVLHASLSGSLGREPLVNATGCAAIIAPCIQPFPPNGILSETPFDREEIAVADLDFNILLASREQGDVRNWADRDKGNWAYGSQS